MAKQFRGAGSTYGATSNALGAAVTPGTTSISFSTTVTSLDAGNYIMIGESSVGESTATTTALPPRW